MEPLEVSGPQGSVTPSVQDDPFATAHRSIGDGHQPGRWPARRPLPSKRRCGDEIWIRLRTAHQCRGRTNRPRVLRRTRSRHCGPNKLVETSVGPLDSVVDPAVRSGRFGAPGDDLVERTVDPKLEVPHGSPQRTTDMQIVEFEDTAGSGDPTQAPLRSQSASEKAPNDTPRGGSPARRQHPHPRSRARRATCRRKDPSAGGRLDRHTAA